MLAPIGTDWAHKTSLTLPYLTEVHTHQAQTSGNHVYLCKGCQFLFCFVFLLDFETVSTV